MSNDFFFLNTKEVRRGLTSSIPEGLRYCVNKDMLPSSMNGGSVNNFQENININSLNNNLAGLANLGSHLGGLGGLNSLANGLGATNGTNFFPTMIPHSSAQDSSIHNPMAALVAAGHQHTDLNSHIKSENN